MCGRIGRPDLTWKQLYELQRRFVGGLAVTRDPAAQDLAASWNVKPTQQIDFASLRNGTLLSSTARWWFVPHWFDGATTDWKQTTFNARIETAADKPSFRGAWANQRCIIPALGYYEWTGEKGAKQPWWITTQRNDPLLYFAGLYSQREDGNTCTILTRAALPQIAHIHSRSPVILTDEDMPLWLSGQMDTQTARDRLGTEWEGRMQFHEVARFKQADDGPELIEPLARLL